MYKIQPLQYVLSIPYPPPYMVNPYSELLMLLVCLYVCLFVLSADGGASATPSKKTNCGFSENLDIVKFYWIKEEVSKNRYVSMGIMLALVSC